MGCSSCSTNNGLPGGCKNNGACGTYGCNKLDVFDWLAGVPLADGQKPFDIAEVRFKNSRKGFFRIAQGLELAMGDVVAVESSPGHDIGVVSLTGELVRIQMRKKDVKDNYEIKKIYRKAKQEDIEKWQEARQLEQTTMMRSREIARELNLQMKISDVEYQGDKTKATFFYTADDRVDFRELIKRYAETFKVRIEMRQIGLRVEAGRLGGIGSCGRELCCSSWLTDFRAVSTSAARYQQLSLNPAKLAGQCGKLKCCLNYELDQYVEALREIPSSNARLKLPKGMAHHFKTDIFKRMMYYVYDDQPGEAPIALHANAVKEIMEMNRKGIAVEDVDDFVTSEDVVEETDFAQVVGQDSLTRFDKQRRGGKGGRNRRDGRDNRDNRNRPRGGNAEGNAGAGSNAPKGERPQQQPREGGAPQQRQQGQQQNNNNRGNRPPQRQRNEGSEGGAPQQPRQPQQRPPQQREGGQQGQKPQQQNQQGQPREKREGNPRPPRGNRGPKPQGPKDAPQQP
jgi:cell fate regulator YaaT (PSP1 superfamily)